MLIENIESKVAKLFLTLKFNFLSQKTSENCGYHMECLFL